MIVSSPDMPFSFGRTRARRSILPRICRSTEKGREPDARARATLARASGSESSRPIRVTERLPARRNVPERQPGWEINREAAVAETHAKAHVSGPTKDGQPGVDTAAAV